MIILDTNVISEIAKGPAKAAAPVADWFRRVDRHLVYVTTVALAELWNGVALLPEGRRRRELADTTETLIVSIFADRILIFDEDAARAFAVVCSTRTRLGLAAKAMDMQMAAIAHVRDMSVATRDIKDFERCGVPLINPWEPAS